MFTILLTILNEVFNSIFFMLGYVSGDGPFEPPLTPEEEKEYFRLYSEGDAEAKNILVIRNMRLISLVVNKHATPGCSEYSDLISIGTIALLKAVEAFDLEKGVRFASFASKCIENEIFMHFRKANKLRNEISLQQPIDVDKDGNEIELIDVLQHEAQSIEDKVETNILKKYVKKIMNTMLKEQERSVLELRFGIEDEEEKTQQEVARMLGISRTYVSRIESKAIRKLKETLEYENILL